MINWDYMITYGGPELFVGFVVVVITPIIYWLILKRFKLVIKIISILCVWFIAVFIAYWDVYQISKEAERLCQEEAGLHVYKTVEADGLAGVFELEDWIEYGFTYVENETIMGGKKRYTLHDDLIVEEKVNSFISDYEYVKNIEVLEMPFNRSRKIIQDRTSGEVLGEIVSFAVYPGWLDSRLLGFMGFTWSPVGCDGDYLPQHQKITLYYDDLIKAVIKPKVSDKGDMP